MNQYLLYKYAYFVNLYELFYLNKFILKECKQSSYSFYLHGKYLYFLVHIISMNRLTFSDNDKSKKSWHVETSEWHSKKSL